MSRTLGRVIAVPTIIGIIASAGLYVLFAAPHSAEATTNVVFLTSGSTWTVPSDWNSLNNTIEVIGGGGGGGGTAMFLGGGGGGGGAYSKISNVVLTTGSSIMYAVGAAGLRGATFYDGTAGGDSYFNAASCGSAFVCAKGGAGGSVLGPPGSGGTAGSGVGAIKYSGGNGGARDAGGYAGGGGGAAGLNGAGNSSGGIAGGSGDSGLGGAGGSAHNPGSPGTEWNATHGSGGGGGGDDESVWTAESTGGNGGNYGGGGGGGLPAAGGAGGQGLVIITYTPQSAPTCSVTVDTNPINYGATTALRWSSTNANTSFYINNVGYVTPNTSSQTSVGPLATTNYDGTAVGPGGSVSCPRTLTVNPPASCTLPWGGTLTHGSSVTAYQAATVSYGSSCISESRTCTNGSLPGSYTYSSCAVGPMCTISPNPNSITQGQSSTLTWTSQNATSCTGTNFSTGGATAGSLQVSPSQTTTYTATCSGAGGSASCGGGWGQSGRLTVSCQQSWSCTGGGQTITQTNTNCTTQDLATCAGTPESFCSNGSSTCLSANPSFNASGSLTGHLQVRPLLVNAGDTAKLYWNISNVLSCSVSGNGETKSGLSGNGIVTAPILSLVTYTLTCRKLPDGSSSFPESQTVNIVPGFEEL